MTKLELIKELHKIKNNNNVFSVAAKTYLVLEALTSYINEEAITTSVREIEAAGYRFVE